mmetsp:Transcript_41173/g.63448  ORF Transcript_41173/g.63448 Transcript_41173/m.63448 type:complete len:124 (-) Transcript_41173:14-385(-)
MHWKHIYRKKNQDKKRPLPWWRLGQDSFSIRFAFSEGHSADKHFFKILILYRPMKSAQCNTREKAILTCNAKNQRRNEKQGMPRLLSQKIHWILYFGRIGSTFHKGSFASPYKESVALKNHIQ